MKFRNAFTFLEVLVALVLLGILAASSIPKFYELAEDAKTSTVDNLAASLSASVNLVHAQWQTEGKKAETHLEGTKLVMSNLGWPEGTTGAVADGEIANRCLELWNALLDNPPLAGLRCDGDCEFLVSAESNRCDFTDEQGRGQNIISYNLSSGQVSFRTTNVEEEN